MSTGTPSVLLYPEEVFRIQGAVYAVSNSMGHGFLEAVYQECLAIEFAACGVPFEAMPQLQIAYRGAPLRQTYRPDFVCFEVILVELKAVSTLLSEHRAQVLNYLKASGLRLGLLVNFGGGPKVQIERFAL